MKNYYVELSAKTYCKAIIKADSEEEAERIAFELMSKYSPDIFFQETESYNVEYVSEDYEEHDYPILDKDS